MKLKIIIKLNHRKTLSPLNNRMLHHYLMIFMALEKLRLNMKIKRKKRKKKEPRKVRVYQ
jgi:hypothetical protein